MKSIRQRPRVVESRTQIGHWEGDLIIGAGQRSAIATLVERKARHTILVGIRGGHNAENVGNRLIETFTGLPPALRRTLTWDQGNELFHHQRIEQATRSGSISLTRIHPGSEEPTRTPMDFYDSTFRKEPTSIS